MRYSYLVLLLALAPGCTNPSVAGEIKGEPVCPDFELGAARTKMKGSLKKPVQISVLEDDEVRWERVLLGKRTAEDADPKFVVEDGNETYNIRWAQCPNVFAPQRVDLKMRPEDISSSYGCGEAVTYHEQQLEVRKGDPSSRVLEWVAPPEPACWTSAVPDEPEKPEEKPEEKPAEEEAADAGSGGAGADEKPDEAAKEGDTKAPPPEAAPKAAPPSGEPKGAPKAPPKGEPAPAPPKAAPAP